MGEQGIATVQDMGDSVSLMRPQVDFRVHAGEGYMGAVIFPGPGTVETVVLLCRKHIDAEKQISVTIEAEDGWRSDKPVKATYSQIKDWVAKHYNGMKVHTLYIAQVKEKYGLIERENYNKSKKPDAKVPQVPPDKEEAIEAALRHFRLIEN